MNRVKKILVLIALILMSINALAQEYPKHEVRAVWLTTIGGLDWPMRTYARSPQTIEKQKAELCKILDQYQRANINTVLFQTRVRSTLMYQSGIEPWDACVSGNVGVSPGYDVLKFAIDECHRRGMEFHAWVVTIPCGKVSASAVKQLRSKLPAGMVLQIGDEAFLNPSDSRSGDYLAKICREITQKYDIDGIHLDYIRFPEKLKKKPEANLGRSQITNIVRKIHDAVKREKPWVKLSCSPIGKHDDLKRYWSHGWNARQTVLQDAQAWMREGLMDMEFPMMYFRGDNFYPFAVDWQENSYGQSMNPGLGIYFMTEKGWSLSDITNEMHFLRKYGMGFCFFRSKFFTDNTKGLYDFVCNTFDRYPALTKPIYNNRKAAPKAPDVIRANSVDGTTTITWRGARDNSGGPYLIYNIYASRQYPVDTRKAENILAARVCGERLELGKGKGAGLYYAVTAVDRYGNESKPRQMMGDAKPVEDIKPGWYYVTHPQGENTPTQSKVSKKKKSKKRKK